jgi:hypothetical protein
MILSIFLLGLLVTFGTTQANFAVEPEQSMNDYLLESLKITYMKKSAEINAIRNKINEKLDQLGRVKTTSPNEIESLKKTFAELESLIDELVPAHEELYHDLQILAKQNPSLEGPFQPDTSAEISVESFRNKKSNDEWFKRSGYKSNFYNKIPVIRTGK